MARRMRARRGLAKVSTQELHAELRRRQTGVRALERARNQLMTRLSRLEATISDYGGAIMDGFAGLGRAGRGRPGGRRGGRAGRRGRGRPGRPPGRRRNETSLPEALQRALRGRTMGVAEAADAVMRAGYRTAAANFRTIVNAALLKKDRFRKVSRGKYTAK